MRALIGVVAVVGGLLVSGCGGGAAGSCRIAASGGGGEKCIDFTKGYSSGSAKDTCALAGAMATYSDAECATNNRVGGCTLSSPDGAFTQVQYYYGPTTVAQAMMGCASAGGTFAAN